MRNLFRALAALTALAVVAPAFAADAPATDTTQPAPKMHKKMSKKATKKHSKAKTEGAADTAAAPK